MKLLSAPRLMAALLASFPAPAFSTDETLISIFSQTTNGYKRQTLPNGSFKREYYAISNGGAIAGTVRDHDVEKITFPKIAGIVAEQLAKQSYFLAPDSKSAELLLVIYWGTTVPFNDGNYRSAIGSASSALAGLNATKAGVPPSTPSGGPGIPAGGADGFSVSTLPPEVVAAQESYENALQQVLFLNRVRDRGNEANARLLGYMSEINNANDIARFAGGGDAYNELVSDIEEPRYYVVIQAFDFREALKQKRKPLWVTRISIRTHGNRFEDRLQPMLANAAGVLGGNSGRLLRKPMREGTVEIGEARVIGTTNSPEQAPRGR